MPSLRLLLSCCILTLLATAAPQAAAITVDVDLGSEGCAVTPGGWGAPPSGNNPGQLLHDHFDDVFGDELVVGGLVFEDAQDVTDALPYTGQGGAFKSHAVALAINIAFGDAGLLDGTIGDVTVQGGPYDGTMAYELLLEAEDVLLSDDDIRNNEYSDLVAAMTGFNEERYGCHETPPCPAGVTALPQADGTIVVSWLAVEGAAAYGVYRATGEGDFILLAITDELSFTDHTTVVGETYSYIVTSWDGTLESEDCLAVVATSIPFFPSAALGAVALIGSVGAFVWMRRKG